MKGLKRLLTVALLGPISALAQSVYVVAWVNGAAISSYELAMEQRIVDFDDSISQDAAMSEAQRSRQTLDAMIERKIVVQEALANGLRLSDRELAQILNQIAANNQTSIDALMQTLIARGIDPNRMTQRLREQVLASRYMQRWVNQTPVRPEEHGRWLTNLIVAEQQRYALWMVRFGMEEANGGAASDLAPETVRGHALALVRRLENMKDSERETLLQQWQDEQAQASDLGWVQAEALPSLFIKALNEQSQRHIVGPIRGTDAYFVLWKRDQSDYEERIRVYQVEELILNETPAQAVDSLALEDYTDAWAFARAYNAEMGSERLALVSRKTLAEELLAPELQSMFADLKVGEWSEPYQAQGQTFIYRLLEVEYQSTAALEREASYTRFLSAAQRERQRKNKLAQLRRQADIRMNSVYLN